MMTISASTLYQA